MSHRLEDVPKRVQVVSARRHAVTLWLLALAMILELGAVVLVAAQPGTDVWPMVPGVLILLLATGLAWWL